MANITNELPIKINDGQNYQKYTRNKDLINISIEAPARNYIPIEFQRDSWSSTYTSGVEYNNFYIHVDYSKITPISYQAICYQIPVNNIGLKKGKKYALTYCIENVVGTTTKNAGYIDLTYTDGTSSTTLSNSVPIESGVKTIIFTCNGNPNYLRLRASTWLYQNATSYDLQFYGLYEVDENDKPLGIKPTLSIGNSPIVTTSEDGNIIGKYELTRNVRRHLMQIERKIKSMEDTYNITWR